MAHSYVDFRGQFVLFNDLALIPIVHLLIDEGTRVEPTLPQSSLTMFDYWKSTLSVYAPGCVELKLDNYLNSDAVDTVVSLIDKVHARLLAFGDRVPGRFLTELVNDALITFCDEPTTNLTAVLGKLRQLLSREQGATSGTPA